MPVRVWLLFVGCVAMAAAVDVPSPAGVVLADLASANRARADLAHDEADWRGERGRLQAVIAAARAESERLNREATAVETERDALRAELVRLGTTAEVLAVRATLGEAGERVAARLAALATTLSPGAVTTPASGEADAFTAAAVALDASERAAVLVTTEVVVGELRGARAAAKVLRVAGAAAWWVSLDGTQAGTVTITAGVVRLTPALTDDQRDAIRAALAMVEGRTPAAPMLLPVERSP